MAKNNKNITKDETHCGIDNVCVQITTKTKNVITEKMRTAELEENICREKQESCGYCSRIILKWGFMAKRRV